MTVVGGRFTRRSTASFLCCGDDRGFIVTFDVSQLPAAATAAGACAAVTRIRALRCHGEDGLVSLLHLRLDAVAAGAPDAIVTASRREVKERKRRGTKSNWLGMIGGEASDVDLLFGRGCPW